MFCKWLNNIKKFFVCTELYFNQSFRKPEAEQKQMDITENMSLEHFKQLVVLCGHRYTLSGFILLILSLCNSGNTRLLFTSLILDKYLALGWDVFETQKEGTSQTSLE